jgi:MFS family permease
VLGADAGYLSALQALVMLLAVLGIGRWADRWEERRSMVGADVCRACVLLGVVAVWLISGGPSVTMLVVAVVALALGQAVFQPALQAVLPSLVQDARLLPAANGLLDATDRSARLLGPGLVAILAGAIPMVHFLSLDAVSFLASAAALVLIGRWRPRAASGQARSAETIWHGLVRGFRATARHRLLFYVLLTTWLLNGSWYAVFFLGLPLMITQAGVHGIGGTGLGAYGMVISAYGCTNLAATLVFGSRTLPARPQFQMFGGTVLVGFGVVLLGCATLLPAGWILAGLMASAALGAIGGPMKDIPVAVLRQTRLDHSDKAAAMRAYMAVSNAGTLLAMLLIPGLMVSAGVVDVVVGCGVGLMAIGGFGLLWHAGWSEPALVVPAARGG